MIFLLLVPKIGDNNIIIFEYEGSQKDPWKHRSKGMRCSSCMFFVEKVVENKDINKDINKDTTQLFGRCRRNAPTINGYPSVFGNDWCGEHKLDEEKLLLG